MSDGKQQRSPAMLLAALGDRLRASAIDRGLDINRLRRQVAFERLLVRLAVYGKPAERATWVLKGGLALELRLANQSRATKDLDLALVAAADSGEDVRDRLIEALAKDLVDDHFLFAVGSPTRLADDQGGRAGWRFPVDTRLAGKTFVKVKLDVVARAEEVGGAVEELTFPSALAFAGYPDTVTVAAIDVDQHAAEKVHALTRGYGDRLNTRTKDLVDLVLLIEHRLLDPRRLLDRLHKVFAIRDSHTLPTELPAPPAAWRRDYAGLVADLDVQARTLNDAYALLAEFWTAVLHDPS